MTANSVIATVGYAVRALYRRPGFSLTVLLVMALGIGGTTIVFSVVNSILLRPLPYADPDRLVDLWQNDVARSVEQDTISIPDFFDLREQQSSFAGLSGYRFWRWSMNAVGHEPEEVVGGQVTHNFFSVLGVEPALGRGFVPEDDTPGGEKALILDHHFWESRFGADSGIIGKRIDMDDVAYKVIGVLPASFVSPTGQKEVCWLPLQMDPATAPRDVRWLRGFGRLRPGVSMVRVNRELRAVMTRLDAEHPELNKGRGAFVVQLSEDLVGDVRMSLSMLFVAMAVVLLIALSSIAGLMLAREIERRHEMAIRLALGAGRASLIRMLMTETLALSAVGGALGLCLAIAGVRALPTIVPQGLPRLEEVTLDIRVMMFALVLTLACGTFVGLLPAFKASRLKMGKSLRAGGGTVGKATDGKVLQRLLVASEVAFSVALLISSGLLVKSLYQLQQVHLGFDPQNLLMLDLVLPGSRYPLDDPKRLGLTAFQQNLFEQVRGVAGVQWVGTAVNHPFKLGFEVPVTLDNRPPPRPGEEDNFVLRPVSEDYLRVAGLRLLRGRFFTAADDHAESLPVVVINQALAKRFFGGNGVGHRLSFYGKAREIVGVVDDEKFAGSENTVPPAVYPPFLQAPIPWFSVLVRTSVRPESLVPSLKKAIWRVDPRLAISKVGSMQDLIAQASAKRRFSMWLLCVFAALALTLAVIGVYGLMSYSAAQRTSEVGLRLAIGANRSDIFKLIMSEGVLVLSGGVLVGLIAAYGGTRVLSSQLYETSAFNGGVVFGALGLIVSVGLLACVVPALRSARVNPKVALNSA